MTTGTDNIFKVGMFIEHRAMRGRFGIIMRHTTDYNGISVWYVHEIGSMASVGHKVTPWERLDRAWRIYESR